MTVFYTCHLNGVTSAPAPVKRAVEKDPAVLHAAVHALLAGPAWPSGRLASGRGSCRGRPGRRRRWCCVATAPP